MSSNGNQHTCDTCGHTWTSINAEIAKGVRDAAKANGTGPICELCLHLEMACRIADARKISPFDAMRQHVIRTAGNRHNVEVSHTAGRKPESEGMK